MPLDPASAPPPPAAKDDVDTLGPDTPAPAPRPASHPSARPVPPTARALLGADTVGAAAGVTVHADDGQASVMEPLLDANEDRFTFFPIR